MKKHLNLFFIIVVLLGQVSCNRQITCPEFEEDVLSWTPYQENSVIELYSQIIDSTITFSIRSVAITHTTHYNTGYDCGECFDYIIVTQNDYDNFKFEITISLNKNQVTSQHYWIGDTYFMSGNYIYSELANFLFENNEYDLVGIFEKIDDSKGTIKKLIIAKGIGIIGIIDIYGNTWSLKSNVKFEKFDGQENIKINYISCG